MSIAWEDELRHIPATYEYDDFAIGGKMITANVVVSGDLYRQAAVDREKARRILVEKLVEDILNNNLCVISTMDDPLTMGKRFNVRAYLAPDNQVRILRSLKCPTPNYRP